MKALPERQGFSVIYKVQKVREKEGFIMSGSDLCGKNGGGNTSIKNALGRVWKNAARIFVLMLCIYSCLFDNPLTVSAAGYKPSGTMYELPEDTAYDVSTGRKVQDFCYGKKTLGTLCVFGSVSEESTYRGTPAYSVTGPVTFGYQYDGKFQTGDKEAWHLRSDGEKIVNGIDISGKVKSGVVMIQKSADRVRWENATEPFNDFFSENINGNTSLYTTPEAEIMNGMFYRITVAYSMTRRIASGKGEYFPLDDEYETRDCIEVYEYYIESDRNYITVNDLVTRSVLGNNATTDNGFYIQKNGSTDTVTVEKDGAVFDTVRSYDYFIKPGKYTVAITTNLGKKYAYSVTVGDGLAFTALSPKVYQSERDEGFPVESCLKGDTVFGSPSLTGLSIARTAGTKISDSVHGIYDAYGISGRSVSLFLKLQTSGENLGNGWSLKYDDWGKKKQEEVADVVTGEIGKGALIVQTSKDGKIWKDIDMGRYANGLYTTDFATHYDADENVLIYVPFGEDVIRGIYLRVYFAYQVFNEEREEYADYIEEYAFYLCCNELNAVTIHNLSAEGMVKRALGDADENMIQTYKHAETMLSGACTTTGFRIDKTLNPTAIYTVKKDGVPVEVPDNGTFNSTGKYDIHITSAVGDKKDTVIYVDRSTDRESMQHYFGKGFLSGKRILAEGEYPVYEGGEVQYHIAPVSESYLPVSGTITNLTTGSKITITNSRTAKNAVLTEPGAYEAVLTTNPHYADDDASGDTRIFTFRFTLIPNGSAPGPVVNKKSLEEYAHSSMVDSVPVYYGLIYQSASKGYITLAFATKEAAVNYAYHYEKGMVEQQSDGSYRYNGAFLMSAKTKYESNWDLTDAINYFAEQAVQPLYFNLSDKFTCLTLSPDVLATTENLRTLELSNSVVIFADGQKELLTDTGTLPVINDKPFSYLDPDSNTVSNGVNSFRFVTDRYGGVDSMQVVIADCNGEEYEIQYGRSVGRQLKAAGCPSGVVTITETTMYGDSTSYQAVYIAPDDNHTELTLTGYSGMKAETINLTAKNAGRELTLSSFNIASIHDDLDPFALVIVRNNQREFFYTAGSSGREIWSDPGDYTITCVNRLGYGYTVNVHITESDNASILFSGEGAEELPSIMTSAGEKNVVLPELSRYGYDFMGFFDVETNEIYHKNIPVISGSGEKTLTAVWSPKQVSITLLDPSGHTLETIDAKFGGSYDLSEYIQEDSCVFAGWEKNGTVFSGNTITVDAEENITLKACAEGAQDETVPAVPAPESGGFLWIVLVAAAVFLIAAAVVLLRRRKIAEEKKIGDEEDD